MIPTSGTKGSAQTRAHAVAQATAHQGAKERAPQEGAQATTTKNAPARNGAGEGPAAARDAVESAGPTKDAVAGHGPRK